MCPDFRGKAIKKERKKNNYINRKRKFLLVLTIELLFSHTGGAQEALQLFTWKVIIINI